MCRQDATLHASPMRITCRTPIASDYWQGELIAWLLESITIHPGF
jgi:hypothetical protein